MLSRKRLAKIEETLTQVQRTLNQISETTFKKAAELDRTKELLKDIKVGVNAKVLFDSPTHNFKVKIDLSMPTIELYLDENNNETESPMLRSLNLLKIIGLEDSVNIARKLEEAKRRNKNNGIE